MASAETSQELKRLASNQQALLEAMPEMVLLINAGKSIEYMNPSAISFFGDLRNDAASLQEAQQTIYSELLNLLIIHWQIIVVPISLLVRFTIHILNIVLPRFWVIKAIISTG